MAESTTERIGYLEEVRSRHGELVYDLLVRRLSEQPDVELQSALKALLIEHCVCAIPKQIEELHFCSD